MGEGRPPPSSPLNPPLQVDKGEARAAKAIIFFTNIILHRQVLFYMFTDITIMFLSTDSLY